MAFEELIHKPMSEEQLLAELNRIIQANFEGLQVQYFFMRLGKCSSTQSQLIWIKSFRDEYDFSDFIFDTKFDRACILVKFEKSHFVVLCHGFHLGNEIRIFESSVTPGRPISVTWDIEAREMIPLEILQGFGEIAEELSSSKSRKSV